MKDTEEITALKFGMIKGIDASDADCVGRRGITEEPVGSQNQMTKKDQPQEITIAGYVDKVGITAGHVPRRTLQRQFVLI